jgi:hypothetical protein
VCQHGVGISVGFKDAASAVIVVEAPVEVERARLVLSAVNHFSRNPFKLVQLPFMDRQIDCEPYSLLSHNCTPFPSCGFIVAKGIPFLHPAKPMPALREDCLNSADAGTVNNDTFNPPVNCLIGALI